MELISSRLPVFQLLRSRVVRAPHPLNMELKFFRLPVFHPLIGMDKEEIVRIARRIDTLETSILPYEDCCTVFTPKHPRTKPRLGAVRAVEAKLDVEALISRALENTELVKVRYHG